VPRPKTATTEAASTFAVFQTPPRAGLLYFVRCIDKLNNNYYYKNV
jgi:hypothetical protein